MTERWRRRLSELSDEFVLNQEDQPPFDGWRTQAVGTFRLHTHPRTDVRNLPGSAGEVLIIGTIAARANEAVTSTSCPPGQFVAITPTEVFSDAGSLKQAFFDRSTKTVASSLRLLAHQGARPVSPELLHGSRPDWYWGPRTSFPHIDFLLPSQRLDLRSFQPVFRDLPKPAGISSASAAEKLGTELSQTFVGLANAGHSIQLAMTGGIDSRTLFAAAIMAGVPFETYTMCSRHVHRSDVEIARRISDRFGIRHRILNVEKIDPDELDWYLWYSAGDSVALDSDFHAAGLWQRFGANAIHVRGLGFELGRHKYRDFLSPSDEALIRTDPLQIWKKFTRPWVRPLHRYNRRAFDSYMEWLAATLHLGTLDFRDRLYLEQGIGAWCASSEYALAATGSKRISIANSSSLYDLFVQEDGSEKKSGPLQRAVMHSVDPAFLGFDFVKPTRAERLHYRAVDTLRAVRIWRRLKRLR